MTINLNKPTVPALLQPHLKAFLPLLNKETLIDVVLGMNLELTNEKANVATLTQEVAALSAAAKLSAAHAANMELRETKMFKALNARTAEFEEKYYGLDLQNRKLEKRHAFHVERIADLTKRLAQAEAALGVPCNDEWDSWADEANASRRAMDAALNDFLQTKTLD